MELLNTSSYSNRLTMVYAQIRTSRKIQMLPILLALIVSNLLKYFKIC